MVRPRRASLPSAWAGRADRQRSTGLVGRTGGGGGRGGRPRSTAGVARACDQAPAFIRVTGGATAASRPPLTTTGSRFVQVVLGSPTAWGWGTGGAAEGEAEALAAADSAKAASRAPRSTRIGRAGRIQPTSPDLNRTPVHREAAGSCRRDLRRERDRARQVVRRGTRPRRRLPIRPLERERRGHAARAVAGRGIGFVRIEIEGSAYLVLAP